MNAIERLAIERECEQLMIAYARGIDFRDYDNVAHLFTEDGVLDVGNPLHGRAAIQAALARRPYELRSRHVLTNLFVDVVSALEAAVAGDGYGLLLCNLGEDPHRERWQLEMLIERQLDGVVLSSVNAQRNGDLLRALYPAGAVPCGDLDALAGAAHHLLAAPPPMPVTIPYTLAAMQSATLDVYDRVASD